MHLKNLWLQILAARALSALSAGGDADHDGTVTNGDFTINTATGLITAKTGRLDFENPNDAAGTAADNNYQITVVYTDRTIKPILKL